MTKTPELIVDVAKEPGGTLVTVTGDLDYESSPRLRATVDALGLTPGQVLMLDLSGLTFFDSSGVTALIIARRTALAAGATIGVTDLSPMVSKIFRITGLDEVFPSYASAQEALAQSPAARGGTRS